MGIRSSGRSGACLEVAVLMKAQRVFMPTTGVESWTVVDQDFGPVEAAERYLAFLFSIERSPNTVR